MSCAWLNHDVEWLRVDGDLSHASQGWCCRHDALERFSVWRIWRLSPMGGFSSLRERLSALPDCDEGFIGCMAWVLVTVRCLQDVATINVRHGWNERMVEHLIFMMNVNSECLLAFFRGDSAAALYAPV
ncbi:MAG TPA: hypothetical protein ACQGQH_07815 [Xylella sp.]